MQSANATNQLSDRAALDQEVQQRLAEIDRIATQTSFNGQKVLDGTLRQRDLPGRRERRRDDLGRPVDQRAHERHRQDGRLRRRHCQYNNTLNVGQQGGGVTAAALGSGALTIALGSGAAVSVGGSASYAGVPASQGANSAYAKAAAINAAGIGGLTATADTTVQVAFTNVTTTNTAYSLSVNGTAIYTNLDTSATGTNTALTGTAVVTAINSNASASGVTATFDSVNNRISLQAVDGRDITVTQTTTGEVGTGFGALGGTNNAANVTTGSPRHGCHDGRQLCRRRTAARSV